MHAGTNPTLVFPPDESGLDREPRCLGCGYRLVGLSHCACPECGRRFDPRHRVSYSRRRPFVWYRYWWPGVLLSLISGLLWAMFFYRVGAFGWGLFIGVPFTVGTLIGYGGRFNGWMGILLGPVCLVVVVALLVLLLMFGGFAGLFCGAILLVFLIPIGIGGVFFGIFTARALAAVLKQTSFSQREYLPVLLMFLAMPGLLHLMQVAFAPPLGPETVQTSRVLAMDADSAWRAQLFYEEVQGPRPWLHRIGLPMPERIDGDIKQDGDRAAYYYASGGLIVKRATVVEPGRLLEFEIEQQRGFEDQSLRFIRGCYTFEPAGSERTRVTLASEYQPMLRPRLLWRPIERAMAGQLHGHVLDGMERQAPRDRITQTRPGNGGTP